jgi:C-terminal processing protease CtpA/Prc
MLYHLGTVKPTIFLSPGVHKLSAKIKFDKGDANNPNTYVFINDMEFSELINFELDVKENTMYQIVATTDDKHNRKSDSSYEITIKKEIAKNCEYNNKSQKVKKPNKKNNNTIPANLQYRLDLVMMDLKAYLHSKNIINKTISVEKKQHIINTIGIVTNRNTPAIKGINIRAITPFSIAAKLGLKPYDTILSINGIDLTIDNRIQAKNLSTLSQFKDVLINLNESEKVKIEVMRDNHKTVLLSHYKELSLPSYKLKIMMD